MLECVINVSEGRDQGVLAALGASAGDDLLDVHSDADHNRTVLTLVGESAPRAVTRAAVELLDLGRHEGVHPRLGVVDVVPFVALQGSSFDDAVAARDSFATWASRELGIPCFLYGPERSLPEVRRRAWRDLSPDACAASPDGRGVRPHPTAGAICVGARRLLVAWNVWLEGADVSVAREIAASVRTDAIRTLGLRTGDHLQVSVNLVDPLRHGPDEAWDAITAEARRRDARVIRAELVGLAPRAVLDQIDETRWEELDLASDRTIEARLARRAR